MGLSVDLLLYLLSNFLMKLEVEAEVKLYSKGESSFPLIFSLSLSHLSLKSLSVEISMGNEELIPKLLTLVVRSQTCLRI